MVLKDPSMFSVDMEFRRGDMIHVYKIFSFFDSAEESKFFIAEYAGELEAIIRKERCKNFFWFEKILLH